MEVSIQNDHITEDEAALYDRQIRLWGIEAQQRMRNSKILVVGMRGLSNEVCKNLALAGVGAITILDDQVVKLEDVGAQFFLTEEDVGKSRAAVSADRVRNLNPRVRVAVDTGNIAQKPKEFFQEFDVLCVTDCNLDNLIYLDELCRECDKKFYAASTYGLFGYIFCDLKHHECVVEYREEKAGNEEPEIKRVRKEIDYVSLKSVLSKKDYGGMSLKKFKRINSLLWAIPILWKFQLEEGRLPIPNNDEDFTKLKSLRDSHLSLIGIETSVVANEFLSILGLNAHAELSAVCAIVGGILAQDILKTLSHNDLPLNNFFVYNGLESSGIVYQVEPGRKIL